MGSNIETKAWARDFERFKAAAESLSGGAGEVIEQEDTFFVVAKGRLKLRMFSPATGELIFYEREEALGPRASHYSIAWTSDPVALKATLAAALGVRGVVRKRRHVFLVGHTRVHLDEVEGLGQFIELEVVLQPGQSQAEAENIARDLMKQLDVRNADLIDKAYIDLLELKGVF